ncbi:pyrroline-5-carboxylate reductase dimerization-domain-containing protein [Camillea tinctor]|nr:pyrroline-5-carboxylate reductase dimerization-domain-containing protein [Camillea tinctor]
MAESTSKWKTLCILGCGNLGTALLKSIVSGYENGTYAPLPFRHIIACVRSEASGNRLYAQFAHLAMGAGKPTVHSGIGAGPPAAQMADVVILGVDPADVEALLAEDGMRGALAGKLVISVAAGWTRQQLERALHQDASPKPWVIRALPNVAASVGQSITAVEEPSVECPAECRALAESIFARVGKTVVIAPRLMDAFTAVGGSTPAFFAVICDALIDAAVAVGVPRVQARTIIYQSMAGTAALLQSGVHPGVLKDEGTSPEGCTIGGLMVLEEGAVRGHLGRGLREAVTIARLMGSSAHVNDTRH